MGSMLLYIPYMDPMGLDTRAGVSVSDTHRLQGFQGLQALKARTELGIFLILLGMSMGYIYRKHMPFISTWNINMVIQQWIYEMFNSFPLIFRQHPTSDFHRNHGIELETSSEADPWNGWNASWFFLGTSQTLSLIILTFLNGESLVSCLKPLFFFLSSLASRFLRSSLTYV